MVVALALLVAAQLVRLAIPWLFGCAVNALQTQGADGVRHAGWYSRRAARASAAAAGDVARLHERSTGRRERARRVSCTAVAESYLPRAASPGDPDAAGRRGR